jgi:hypothetical protein
MVPTQTSGLNPYLYNTAGSTFTKQTYGGTIVGLSAATTSITKAILVKDINTNDTTNNTLPKLLSGARTYDTAKILSAGTFAYNAAKNGTWVLTRVTTTLAGVSKTFLQSIGNVGYAPSLAYYVRDNWVNTTSLIRRMQLSFTGYSAAGGGYNGKIKARTPWITSPTGTAGADFGTSTSLPSRAYPGELYILTNFIDYKPATSSNKYYYSPITGK